MIEVGCFFLIFMNNIIQTGLPLKMIHVSLINVTKWNTFEKLLFCFPYLIICLKIVNLRLSFFEVFNSNFNI